MTLARCSVARDLVRKSPVRGRRPNPVPGRGPDPDHSGVTRVVREEAEAEAEEAAETAVVGPVVQIPVGQGPALG